MTTSNPQRVGNVAGTPIIAELGGALITGNPSDVVAVTLTADYTMENPPGYPSRPPPGTATPFYPRTLSSGETHSFFRPEAKALVDAGAATYA